MAAEGSSGGGGGEEERQSRYMRDASGALLHKWTADYAPRAGSGRAQCNDLQCLEKEAQKGERFIEKGALRIGRRVLLDQGPGKEGQLRIIWHHARCMFNTFSRARSQTRVIQADEDIEGFGNLRVEDQALLRRIISGTEDIRGVRFETNLGAGGTPEKRKRGPKKGSGDGGGDDPAAKRARTIDGAEEKPKNGDRVWAHFRARGEAADGLGGAKSKKPEIAQLVDCEVRDGKVVVQFESADHHKIRMERFTMRRFRRIQPWLKYPRLFEGPKQRLPVDWIQWKRRPPALCGCTKQEWAHECAAGMNCTRGQLLSIFGVCQSGAPGA